MVSQQVATMSPWRVGAAALALQVSACLSPSDPEVEVSLLASASSVSAAQPVDILVRVTNLGPGPVRVQAMGCPPTFDVFDEVGDLVGPSTVLCIAVATPPRRLEPTEVFTFEHVWDGEVHRDGSDVLEEGAFRLEGKVWVQGRGMVRSRGVDVQVVSR